MLKKVIDNVIFDKPIKNYIVCGDSGCDGYNTEAVIILQKILSAEADFSLIAGDLVTIGSEQYYGEFVKLIDSISKSEVYCAVGNHDIEHYEKYIGLKNYFISAPNLLLIVLDNSRRYFNDETLVFLKETLDKISSQNIAIVFHIPPQNPFILNNISNEEWNKIKNICDPFKDKIDFIFCGHIHSAFDYNLDGYRVIVTGGAGSQLDPIDNTCLKNNNYHYFKIRYINGKWKPEIIEVSLNNQTSESMVSNFENNNYHYFKIRYINGKWKPEIIEVSLNNQTSESMVSNFENEKLVTALNDAFAGEAMAHRKYRIFSEIAEKQGYKAISELFKAASESEYIHAQMMFIAAGGNKNTSQNLRDAINRETEEIEKIYPEGIEISSAANSIQAELSFKAALEAEKGHLRQFKKAIDALASESDISSEQYHICSRCGYMHTGDKPPKRCPGCGADMFKFRTQK